jgi:hypothetical protein
MPSLHEEVVIFQDTLIEELRANPAEMHYLVRRAIEVCYHGAYQRALVDMVEALTKKSEEVTNEVLD